MLPATPGERIVCGDHDVLALDSTSVGFDSKRPLEELLGAAVLVDLAALRTHGSRQCSQIHARMEPGLIRKTNARTIHKRHVLDKYGVEPKLGGKRRIFCEGSGLIRVGPSTRCVQVAVDSDRTRSRSRARQRCVSI